MRVEYQGHETRLQFACESSECDGTVRFSVPREAGDYSGLTGTCGECGGEQELGVTRTDDYEHPHGVPALSHEEYEAFLDELEEFEVSEEMQEDLQKHMEILAEEDDAEFTDPSESGLRSGRGNGLLRRLFFEDDD